MLMFFFYVMATWFGLWLLVHLIGKTSIPEHIPSWLLGVGLLFWVLHPLGIGYMIFSGNDYSKFIKITAHG